MKTLDIFFTRGDASTQPGGVILRHNEKRDEYVTHAFTRIPHTREPKEFFWGHYFMGEVDGKTAEQRARKDFAERCISAEAFEVRESDIVAKGDPGFDISGNWEGDNNG